MFGGCILERGYRLSWGTNCGGRLAGGSGGWGSEAPDQAGEGRTNWVLAGVWFGGGGGWKMKGERRAKHQTELGREDKIWVLDCKRVGGGGSEATERAGRKEQTEWRCWPGGWWSMVKGVVKQQSYLVWGSHVFYLSYFMSITKWCSVLIVFLI